MQQKKFLTRGKLMKILSITLLLSILLLFSFSSTASGQEEEQLKIEVKELKARVEKLEKEVQKIKDRAMPVQSQSQAQERRKILREKFNKRWQKDSEKYSSEQLRDLENLYQVANKNWRSEEAKKSLEELLKKYPDTNRTGCAVLYMAQWSEGEEREKRLKEAMGKFDDCFYGNGVQVGAYARYLLGYYYLDKGEKEKAKTLFNEILEKYPDAIGHDGESLAEKIKGIKFE
jgi:tetratricopeptide (TPR) repeat protein